MEEDPKSENDDAIIWDLGEAVEEPATSVGFIPRVPNTEDFWVPDNDGRPGSCQGLKGRTLVVGVRSGCWVVFSRKYI